MANKMQNGINGGINGDICVVNTVNIEYLPRINTNFNYLKYIMFYVLGSKVSNNYVVSRSCLFNKIFTYLEMHNKHINDNEIAKFYNNMDGLNKTMVVKSGDNTRLTVRGSKRHGVLSTNINIQSFGCYISNQHINKYTKLKHNVNTHILYINSVYHCHSVKFDFLNDSKHIDLLLTPNEYSIDVGFKPTNIFNLPPERITIYGNYY